MSVFKFQTFRGGVSGWLPVLRHPGGLDGGTAERGRIKTPRFLKKCQFFKFQTFRGGVSGWLPGLRHPGGLDGGTAERARTWGESAQHVNAMYQFMSTLIMFYNLCRIDLFKINFFPHTCKVSSEASFLLVCIDVSHSFPSYLCLLFLLLPS